MKDGRWSTTTAIAPRSTLSVPCPIPVRTSIFAPAQTHRPRTARIPPSYRAVMRRFHLGHCIRHTIFTAKDISMPSMLPTSNILTSNMLTVWGCIHIARRRHPLSRQPPSAPKMVWYRIIRLDHRRHHPLHRVQYRHRFDAESHQSRPRPRKLSSRRRRLLRHVAMLLARRRSDVDEVLFVLINASRPTRSESCVHVYDASS